MEPHINTNDKVMFYKYLDKATHYFEFGAGGSTYQASIRDNIKKIYFVESCPDWFEKVKDVIHNENVTMIYNDMNTLKDTWGHPGLTSTTAQKKSYSEHLLQLDLQSRKKIDFILIDGRFRVACALKCFDAISDNCLIAFDDFLNRPNYHVVLDYYNVVDKTKDQCMVILKKKPNVSVSSALIKQYELIAD